MAEETKVVDTQSSNVLDNKQEKDDIITKHPLQNEWDFWYLKPSRTTKLSWADGLIKIHSFKFVEDFWALYNHIELPSRIPIGSDYSLFKAGIKPMWECNENKNGGRLQVAYRKQMGRDSFQKSLEDKIWLEACLCLIGEAFGEENDKICGLVFNCRAKFDRISIWTSDWSDQEGIAKIGNILRNRVGFNEKLCYEKHNDDKGQKQPLYTI